MTIRYFAAHQNNGIVYAVAHTAEEAMTLARSEIRSQGLDPDDGEILEVTEITEENFRAIEDGSPWLQFQKGAKR